MANIETTLPGGEKYSAKRPTADQFTRFIGHVKAKNLRVGYRELGQVCCTSHAPDDAAKLLAKYPGAIVPLGEALVDIAASDEAPIPEEGAVAFAGFSFRAPTIEEWEEYQELIGLKTTDDHGAALELLEKLSNSPGKMTARCQETPADVQVVMNAVAKLAGVRIKIAVKKG